VPSVSKFKDCQIKTRRTAKMLRIALATALLAVAVRANSSQCTEEQLNKAKLSFKDCLEEKKASLLKLNFEEKGNDLEIKMCSGLKEMSTGCEGAVREFAFCRGREHVDLLVEIHLNAISDVLAPFHPSLKLKECPVFHTPAPPIIHQKPEPEAAAAPEPEPEYITASVSGVVPTLLLTLSAALYLTL